jgi:hypothetical protein
MNLMALSDEDEYLNGSQHNTDGSVKILKTTNAWQAEPELSRYEGTTTGSTFDLWPTDPTLPHLSVVYHADIEAAGATEQNFDLPLKYKENAFFDFTPNLLVPNTRDSYIGTGGAFIINGTYERLDVSGINLPQIQNGQYNNQFYNINPLHIGKASEMAAVIADNGNSVLSATDITFTSVADVFTDYNDKLMLMQIRRERNLVDESEL